MVGKCRKHQVVTGNNPVLTVVDWPAVEEVLDSGEGVLKTNEVLKHKTLKSQSFQMLLQECLHDPDIPFA